MLGLIVVVLIIGALISVIWGREAAQNIFSSAGGCIGNTIALIILLAIGIFAPIFLVPMVLLFIGTGIYAYQDQKKSREQDIQRNRERVDEQIRQQNEREKAAIASRNAACIHKKALTDALEYLQHAVKATDDAMFNKACRCLRDLGELEHAVPVIELLLNDKRFESRFCGLAGIACGYHDANAVSTHRATNVALLKLAIDCYQRPKEAAGIRIAALLALGYVDYECDQFFLDALCDSDPEVRAAACYSIASIATRRKQSPLSVAAHSREQLVNMMINLLNDDSVKVCEQAAITLGILAEPRSLRYLQQIAESSKAQDAVGIAARQAVDAISRAALDKSTKQ